MFGRARNGSVMFTAALGLNRWPAPQGRRWLADRRSKQGSRHSSPHQQRRPVSKGNSRTNSTEDRRVTQAASAASRPRRDAAETERARPSLSSQIVNVSLTDEGVASRQDGRQRQREAQQRRRGRCSRSYRAQEELSPTRWVPGWVAWVDVARRRRRRIWKVMRAALVTSLGAGGTSRDGGRWRTRQRPIPPYGPRPSGSRVPRDKKRVLRLSRGESGETSPTENVLMDLQRAGYVTKLTRWTGEALRRRVPFPVEMRPVVSSQCWPDSREARGRHIASNTLVRMQLLGTRGRSECGMRSTATPTAWGVLMR
ncbi:hypothetical protein FKP32DRAFT_1269741 [Trametes sanguinea]|nr:hypothetical protein FKP32DRAFT_1269741 [Trametes sanguinea]